MAALQQKDIPQNNNNSSYNSDDDLDLIDPNLEEDITTNINLGDNISNI